MSELTAYATDMHPSGSLEVEILPRQDFSDIKSLIVIPVAAHQEDIASLANAYQDIDPTNTGLYLFLNAPDSYRNHQNTRKNIEYLEKVSTQLGSLVIGGGFQTYDWGGTDGHFSMGKIRRDAWLHLLKPAVSGGIDENAFGFSHDADIRRISPNLFQVSQMAASDRPSHLQHVTPYWSLDDTETKNQNLPALNRLAAYITISEEAFRLSTKTHRMWDWAVGFRLGSYALSGGYREDATHSETTSIVDNLKAERSLPLFTSLNSEFLVTSMRRFVIQAASGISPFDITDPSIGPEDNLRDDALPIELAESTTRANFIDWCRNADKRNIANIVENFSEKDGSNIDIRIVFYQDLANHGRLLMQRYGRALDHLSSRAQYATYDIVTGLHQKYREIITS